MSRIYILTYNGEEVEGYHLLHKMKAFFICSLFKNAFSISDYVASYKRMIVNNELEMMWKEAVMA
jgi:hypothetical protein